MIKKIFNQIELTCMMQDENTQNATCKGVITMNPGDGKFRFEEAAPAGKVVRNVKLYEGQYVSIVHMQNGKYQCHMRTLTASPEMNCEQLAFSIYSELLEALRVMD